MTTCLLVRHAAIDFGVRHLAGRSECALSPSGEKQAKNLVRLLPRGAIVHSSPKRRCLQTINPYTAANHSRTRVFAKLDEIDFGAWTGRPFASLDRDPVWREWNERRSIARAPYGERMSDVRDRVIEHIRVLVTEGPHATFIVVTHAELIRSVILHCMSLSLDDWERIEVPHASITTVKVERSGQFALERRLAA